MKNEGYMQGLAATAQMSMYIMETMNNISCKEANEFEEGFMSAIEEWITYIRKCKADIS